MEEYVIDDTSDIMDHVVAIFAAKKEVETEDAPGTYKAFEALVALQLLRQCEKQKKMLQLT
jgi:hypothetical protein